MAPARERRGVRWSPTPKPNTNLSQECSESSLSTAAVSRRRTLLDSRHSTRQKKSPIDPRHLAFLVGEDDFDAIWGRIREQGRQFWADPFKSRPGEINHGDGGRGLYWEGPDGHWLEIITVPYGGG